MIARKIRVARDRQRQGVPTMVRHTLEGLAHEMRSSDMYTAASALLVADDAFQEYGLPNPISSIDVNAAKRVLKHQYIDVDALSVLEQTAPKSAANDIERMLAALDWAARVRKCRFIADDQRGLRVMKRGRVVARGRNLATIDRYVRKTNGATLILIQSQPHGGYLHIFFNDGATVSTKWPRSEIEKRWIQKKRWLSRVPVLTFQTDYQRASLWDNPRKVRRQS